MTVGVVVPAAVVVPASPELSGAHDEVVVGAVVVVAAGAGVDVVSAAVSVVGVVSGAVGVV